MSFTNVFGGGVLQPADVAQRTVTLSANVTLQWPDLSTTATDYVARIMDVTATSGSLTITMPPANQVSTGENVLFTNPGSNTYTILKNDGSTLVSVTAGQQVMIYVTDNSTVAGTWNSFLFGSGSSSLSAASVQGYGVKAIGATLNLDWPSTSTAASFTIATTDRARLYVWTGGAGTITLPAEATATTGFVFAVRNQGTGTLTIAAATGETINSLASITLQPNDSCFVHAAAAATWYTVGLGRNTQFNFTQLTKTVTGGTDTLTMTEAANVVQRYTGTLTSNETVVLPAVVQIYYVTNATSGSYTFTMQSPTPGSTLTIPQGQSVIVFCDGVNVTQANNSLATNVSSLILNAGTVTAPSLTFSSYPSTGLYSSGANNFSLSSNGTMSISVSASGQVTIPNVNITGGTISGVTLPSAPVPDYLLFAQGII